MKEVLYRNLVSRDKKKKIVALREIFQKGKIKINFFKRCFYIVTEIRKIKSEDLSSIINSLIPENSDANHIYIKKIIENKKINKVSYILKGKFYVVKDTYLYSIFFRQEILVNFENR